jgi:hypothetical protein
MVRAYSAMRGRGRCVLSGILAETRTARSRLVQEQLARHGIKTAPGHGAAAVGTKE